MNTLKQLLALTVCVSVIGISSCTKSDTTQPASSSTVNPLLPSQPEALAAYDHSSAGVVKGVIVGSSGNFKFSIKNGNDSIYCKLTFDGKTGMLYSTSFANWSPGQAITKAVFTGIIGGVNVSVTLSCNADGTNPSITVSIPGHNVNVCIYKETSSQLVKGYEGTYTTYDAKTGAKADTGTFNFVTYNSVANIYHSGSDGSGNDAATVSGTKLIFHDPTNASPDQSLYIDDFTVSGTLVVSSGTKNAIVAGKRTL